MSAASTTRTATPVSTTPLLSCRALVIGWGKRALLPPIDVEVRRGRVLAVLGRNGSGKSTWLKTVLGLTPPLEGAVVRHTHPLRAAYVPQSSAVEPLVPVSVRDVVAWGRLRGWSFLRPLAAREDRRICEEALAHAQASDLADQRFADLSKGQRQRVLFARMLASQPDLAVLDEPTAAMDQAAERHALDELTTLARARHIAVVLVTHAVDITVAQADDILLFDRVTREVVFGPRDEVLGHPAFTRYSRVHEESVDDP